MSYLLLILIFLNQHIVAADVAAVSSAASAAAAAAAAAGDKDLKAESEKVRARWRDIIKQNPEHFVGALVVPKKTDPDDATLTFVIKTRNKYDAAKSDQPCWAGCCCFAPTIIQRGVLRTDGGHSWPLEDIDGPGIVLMFQGYSDGTNRFLSTDQRFVTLANNFTTAQLEYIQDLHRTELLKRSQMGSKEQSTKEMRARSANSAIELKTVSQLKVLEESQAKMHNSLPGNIQRALNTNFNLQQSDGPVVAASTSSQTPQASLAAVAIASNNSNESARKSFDAADRGSIDANAGSVDRHSRISVSPLEMACLDDIASQPPRVSVDGTAGAEGSHAELEAHTQMMADRAKRTSVSGVDSEVHAEPLPVGSMLPSAHPSAVSSAAPSARSSRSSIGDSGNYQPRASVDEASATLAK